jgi:hypothetical protein
MDDNGKKIDNQGHPYQPHDDFPHGQNLPQAAAKARQRQKKTNVTKI